MQKISASIVGGSGYVGGELIRLLLSHPFIELKQVTSERFANKFIKNVHPIFRGQSNASIDRFVSLDQLHECDVLFLCLPHGKSMKRIEKFMAIATNIIDLSADFRLASQEAYLKWYEKDHQHPELLDKFVYGIPEIHRDAMKNTKYISSAGCNATVSILGLYPLVKQGIIKEDPIIIDVKVGTSEAGNKFSQGSHHPERVRSIRSYKPTSHRHSAEISQELNRLNPLNPSKIYFSATSLDMVRGSLATIQVFLKDEFASMTDKDIWKIYRKEYQQDPFIRIIKEKVGNYRYPDPKSLLASNYCDIGFEKERDSNRIVIISAIDNLMKGAAGQAIQALNIMRGWEETAGLEFPGLYLY